MLSSRKVVGGKARASARALLLDFQGGADPEGSRMTVVEKARKTPRQPRARTTADYILEAATQVLEATGEAGFNTNAVA
jgi:hypothetical protein